MSLNKTQKNRSTVFSLFAFALKNVSRKLKAHVLKTFSDHLFIVLEKILVKFPCFLAAYITYYEDIVENEIHLAAITAGDTVLHIGCGSLPSTSLLIAQKTNALITAVDKDPYSVLEARSCVHHLCQTQHVSVQEANALTYPMDSSSLILVSQGIEPRYEVLRHIAQAMNPEARVLFRTFGSDAGGITTADALLETLFTIHGVVAHPTHGRLISVLLLKKKT